MSDEKEVLKIEIPVEEDEPKAQAAPEAQSEVVDELRSLGKQLAETFRTAWHSSERKQVQAEVREGIRSFGEEVDKVIKEVRSGKAGQKIREEATELRQQAETGELQRKARHGLEQGLRWLSDELEKLTDQFTAEEKEPDVGDEKSPDA